MKNVILITIDGVSYRSFGMGGVSPSPTPTIDELATESLSLTNCYSVGSVTQFSFPGIMSSTLPLDYGGYDRGVLDRPATLAEVFEDNGYYTGAFTTTSWLGRQFGYDRGFTDFHEMYDLPRHHLSSFVGNYLQYYEDEFSKQSHTINVADTQLVPFLSRYFETLIEHCENKIEERSRDYITPSPVIHEIHLEKIQQRLKDEQDEFEEAPSEYISALFQDDGENVFEELMNKYSKGPVEKKASNQFIVKNTLSYLKSNTDNILDDDLLNPYRYAHVAYNLLDKLTLEQQTKVPSSKYILDNATGWINDVADTPFFLWVHLSDVHDESFVSWEYDQWQIRREIEMANQYRERVRKADDWNGNLLNDYALQYVDNKIGELLSTLKKQSLLEETVIGITSDHGRYRADRPFRSYPGIEDFYDENHHVPGIIYGSDRQQEYSELCSSLDFTPTLVDLVGLNIPDEFQGYSIIGEKIPDREYVLMEDAGSGPCDLDHKFVNMAIRTETDKLVRRDGELFGYWDLINDPNEFNRTSGEDLRQKPEVDTLNEIVSERIEKLRRKNRKR